MGTPQRPSVLLFAPFATRASVCGEPFAVAPGAADTHADTEVELRLNDDDTVIHNAVVGEATTNVQVTSLTLSPGEIYKARLRYQSSVGSTWGAWGPWRLARTAGAPALDAATVPAIPQVGGTAPLAPSFRQEIPEQLPVQDYSPESGHIGRRVTTTLGLARVQFRWTSVTAAEQTALLDFLHARIDAGESFRLPADAEGVIDARAWWVDRGTIDVIELAPGLANIECECWQVAGVIEGAST